MNYVYFNHAFQKSKSLFLIQHSTISNVDEVSNVGVRVDDVDRRVDTLEATGKK